MIDNEIDFSLYGVLNKKFKPLSKYSFLNLKYVLIAFFTITILLFNAPYIFLFTSNYSYKLSISIHQKNPFPYTYHQFFNSSFNQLIVHSGILLSIKASSPFISTALSIIFEYTNKHAANCCIEEFINTSLYASLLFRNTIFLVFNYTNWISRTCCS